MVNWVGKSKSWIPFWAAIIARRVTLSIRNCVTKLMKVSLTQNTSDRLLTTDYFHLLFLFYVRSFWTPFHPLVCFHCLFFPLCHPIHCPTSYFKLDPPKSLSSVLFYAYQISPVSPVDIPYFNLIMLPLHFLLYVLYTVDVLGGLDDASYHMMTLKILFIFLIVRLQWNTRYSL